MNSSLQISNNSSDQDHSDSEKEFIFNQNSNSGVKMSNYSSDIFVHKSPELTFSCDSSFLAKSRIAENFNFDQSQNIPKAFLHRSCSSKKLDPKEMQDELIELLTRIESDTQENSNSYNNYIPLKSTDIESNSIKINNNDKSSDPVDLKMASTPKNKNMFNPSKRSHTLDLNASEDSLSFFEEKPLRQSSMFGSYNYLHDDSNSSLYQDCGKQNIFPAYNPPNGAGYTYTNTNSLRFTFSQTSSFNQSKYKFNGQNDFNKINPKEFTDATFEPFSSTHNSLVIPPNDEVEFSKHHIPTDIPIQFSPPQVEYDILPIVKPLLPLNIPHDTEICTLEMAKDQNGSRLIQQNIENADFQEISVMIDQLTFDISNLVILGGDVFGNYVIQKLLDHGNEEHRRLIVSKISGSILSLSLQMYGCRVIQKAIECGSHAIQMVIIGELTGHVLECIKDQNGNHVIQKCIEKINNCLLNFIVEEIATHILELSAHPYGCRVIQRILENFDCKQKESITMEIFDEIPRLVLDQYGNYVVQHILDHCSRSYPRKYIFEYVKKNVFFLSSHKFASNVVEKCLISGSIAERHEIAMEIINKSVGRDDDVVYKMMKDAYANYVIQKMIDVIIENNEIELFQNLVKKVKPHYPNLRKISYGKHIINKIDKITKSLTNYFNQGSENESESLKFCQSHYSTDSILMQNDEYNLEIKPFSKSTQVLCDSLTEFPSLICENSMPVNQS